VHEACARIAQQGLHVDACAEILEALLGIFGRGAAL
jgi:hypothetical protein